MKLEIDGYPIDTQCYNCGDEIRLFEDEPFAVLFDPGEPQTRNYPGEPAAIFLYCHKCATQEGIFDAQV
jgi:hypothetical protein